MNKEMGLDDTLSSITDGIEPLEDMDTRLWEPGITVYIWIDR